MRKTLWIGTSAKAQEEKKSGPQHVYRIDVEDDLTTLEERLNK